MRPVSLSMLVAILAVILGSSARAEEVVTHRLPLPLEGRPVDVAALAGPGEGPVRVRITGTISATIDGSELDALTRRTRGRQFVTDGPFVLLPSRARLVEADPEAHSYLFELPRQPSLPVAANLAPLAVRHLVTRSELLAGCYGALELEVLGRAQPAAIPAPSGAGDGDEPVILVATVAAATALALLLALVVRRRQRRPELALLSRARDAGAAVEAEARPLGPAFGHVVAAAVELVEAARASSAQVEVARAASRRLRRLPGAGRQRAVLDDQRRDGLERLRGIAGRLEDAAGALAARHADACCRRDLEDNLVALSDELDSAVAATEEARLAV